MWRKTSSKSRTAHPRNTPAIPQNPLDWGFSFHLFYAMIIRLYH
ncbi:hypothetical protein CLOSTASPAR_03696 [[Clostridium] asparagiforme DSM 15981]|uniref:Uncharacterized protein n=1 Tax=[Clostridium] asparagiforme DSM 15981 TaxID=518636 RepID=C0D356_9FIRM|nr:hypothetical protein CLOSTASPAR_03696 [[Clostridium] asparagiforme DSM 15981]